MSTTQYLAELNDKLTEYQMLADHYADSRNYDLSRKYSQKSRKNEKQDKRGIK